MFVEPLPHAVYRTDSISCINSWRRGLSSTVMMDDGRCARSAKCVCGCLNREVSGKHRDANDAKPTQPQLQLHAEGVTLMRGNRGSYAATCCNADPRTKPALAQQRCLWKRRRKRHAAARKGKQRCSGGERVGMRDCSVQQACFLMRGLRSDTPPPDSENGRTMRNQTLLTALRAASPWATELEEVGVHTPKKRKAEGCVQHDDVRSSPYSCNVSTETSPQRMQWRILGGSDARREPWSMQVQATFDR
jgi:hypothetical protein